MALSAGKPWGLGGGGHHHEVAERGNAFRVGQRTANVISWAMAAELTPGFSAPPRNALLYTVDMLLPFVDLGHSRWVPHGRVLVVTTVLIGLGRVLATAVVAAFADVLRRSG